MGGYQINSRHSMGCVYGRQPCSNKSIVSVPTVALEGAAINKIAYSAMATTGSGNGMSSGTSDITKVQKKQIETLRNGGEVKVKTYEEARELLDNMQELNPAIEEGKMPNPDGRMRDGFADPNGTYRGDLINKQDPTAPVHPGVQNPNHANYPHYNIKLPNGDKAAIIISGGN